MKTIKLIFALLILVLTLPAVAQQETNQNQTLEEVVVKEKYEAGFEEEKLPVYLSMNLNDVVKIQERIDWSTIGSVESKSQGDNWESFALHLSSPEFANIAPAPVKSFQAQFKNLSSWKLEIITSDGKPFRTLEGDGNPPESIPWDGIGSNGEFLKPGHNYSYSFTPVDKAGNKRTYQGETFSVPAVYFTRGDSVWVGIAASKLFSFDGYGLAMTADDYVKEVASLIKYYAKQGKITIESEHPKTQELVTLLSRNTTISESTFKRKSIGLAGKECIFVLIE